MSKWKIAENSKINMKKSTQNDLLKAFIKEYKCETIILATIAAAISATAFLDVLIVGMASDFDFNNQNEFEIILLIAILIIRNISYITLNYAYSNFGFKWYQKIVNHRFRTITENDNKKYNPNQILNFTLNEALQTILTVVLPIGVIISTGMQLIVYSLGLLLILDQFSATMLVVFILIYAAYIAPTNYYLRKLGNQRRHEEEKRTEFVSSVYRSLREFSLHDKKLNVTEEKFNNPTKKISFALTLKWANSESQKQVIELVAVIAAAIVFFLMTPSATELSKLLPIVFTGYRAMPLLTRLIIANQSLQFGKAALRSLDVDNYDHKIEYYCSDGARGELSIDELPEKKEIFINRERGVVMLSGPSGSGKSTFLYKLATIQSKNKRISYSGQQQFILNASIQENLSLDASDQSVIKKYNLTGLEHRGDLQANSISGGQSARISIV